MRTALRQGWEPQRKGGPRSQIVAPPAGQTMLPVPRGLRGIARVRRESREWSNAHSRKITSRYTPKFTDEEARRYHAAYVDDESRANKLENGLDSLREFLVDQMGYYTDDDFDDRYGLTLTRQMVERYVTPELSARLRGETL